MKRSVNEIPEKWVIIKISNNYYKLFATWAGGYLDGDRWKLNSGIKKVEQDENFYYFTGFSGSCYKCHKAKYGIATTFGRKVLYKILKQSSNEMKLMEDVENWESEMKTYK